MARPREFDRDEALQRAMVAFWELGYDATSTAVLEQRLNIGRSSLYAAFGGKEELYAEAMQRYVGDLRQRVIAQLRAPGPALAVLERFFLGVADRGKPGGEPLRCCMVVRATLLGTDLAPAVREPVRRAIAELDDAFHELLLRARREGALGETRTLRNTARFLTSTFQGLNIAALAGRKRHELRSIVRQALSTLHGPR